MLSRSLSSPPGCLPPSETSQASARRPSQLASERGHVSTFESSRDEVAGRVTEGQRRVDDEVWPVEDESRAPFERADGPDLRLDPDFLPNAAEVDLDLAVVDRRSRVVPVDALTSGRADLLENFFPDEGAEVVDGVEIDRGDVFPPGAERRQARPHLRHDVPGLGPKRLRARLLRVDARILAGAGGDERRRRI